MTSHTFSRQIYTTDTCSVCGLPKRRHTLASQTGENLLTDVAELLVLPEGSVVLDKEGDVSQKRDGLWCGYEMAPTSSRKLQRIAAPFKLLYTPEEG